MAHISSVLISLHDQVPNGLCYMTSTREIGMKDGLRARWCVLKFSLLYNRNNSFREIPKLRVRVQRVHDNG
jgi:hypothetical protein